MIYNFGAAVLRAVGDTRRPLYFLMAAGVMNVLGDLLFVCVLGMGVAGVALATVLSQCVSAALTVLCLTGSDGMCHLDIRRLRFYPERFAQIMKIGLPAGMQSVIFNISNVLIQSSINSFGAVAVAGNTAAANVEGFVYISMNSLYQTTLSFTSQNLGAKQYRRVDGILVRCMILVILIGVVLGQGAYRLGDPLLHIYSQDPEVIAYGIQRFSVVSVTYFLCGMMDVGSGVVRGVPQALVIGGGGSGIALYRALQRHGIPFAAGVLHENDMDFPVARALACEIVAERPYQPIGDAAQSRARALMHACRCVYAPLRTFGPMNEATACSSAEAAENGWLVSAISPKKPDAT